MGQLQNINELTSYLDHYNHSWNMLNWRVGFKFLSYWYWTYFSAMCIICLWFVSKSYWLSRSYFMLLILMCRKIATLSSLSAFWQFSDQLWPPLLICFIFHFRQVYCDELSQKDRIAEFTLLRGWAIIVVILRLEHICFRLRFHSYCSVSGQLDHNWLDE